MKAPASMIAAVKSVQPKYRLAAAKLAEKTYFADLARLEQFGDFNRQTNEEMAAESAAAEVLFYFR